jgi:hypothetical protein
MIHLGLNGHFEYDWSNNVQEKIVQFHSQIVRTDIINIQNLSIKLSEILQTIINSYNECIISKTYYIELLSTMYKMIGSTRDVIEGKGEYTLSYMMIYTWYGFFPELAKYALLLFVKPTSHTIHPYGSWKDIKYFCQYCKRQNNNHLHPLIHYAIQITNEQLSEDLNKISFCNFKTSYSLVSKWIPREKSKFGWLFKELATNFFDYYFTNIPADSYIKACLKAFTNYRKIISYLNIEIKTIQINQCKNQWSKINPKNVTSNTFQKQKYALLNNNLVEESLSKTLDRIICAEKFKIYIHDNSDSIPSKVILLNDFTKNAVDIIKNKKVNSIISDEKMIINSQWKNYTKNINTFHNIIPIIDTSFSFSMSNDSLYAAISLGILVSEKTTFSKRILTLDAIPSWINLESCKNYIEMVEKVHNEISLNGLNANFYTTLDFILETIIREKMSHEQVENMKLAIFSDMQVDLSDSTFISLYEGIKKKYETIGLKLYNKPFNVPHILFWNLKSTYGFPVTSEQFNASLLSGFSPSFLDYFHYQNYNYKSNPTSNSNSSNSNSNSNSSTYINKWKLSNPFLLLKKILYNKRYKPLEKKLLCLLY